MNKELLNSLTEKQMELLEKCLLGAMGQALHNLHMEMVDYQNHTEPQNKQDEVIDDFEIIESVLLSLNEDEDERKTMLLNEANIEINRIQNEIEKYITEGIEKNTDEMAKRIVPEEDRLLKYLMKNGFTLNQVSGILKENNLGLDY